MRRASKVEDITDRNDLPYGVVLAADATAEHETGIRGLKELLGVDRPAPRFGGLLPPKRLYGLARRQITQLPPGALRYEEKDGIATLVVAWGAVRDNYPTHELSLRPDESIAGAWSSDDFGLIARGNRIGLLRIVKQILEERDAIIMVGGSNNPFMGGGLVIAQAKSIEPDVIAQWEEADRDAEALERAAEGTKIKARLRAAGLEWFALSPRWAKEFDDKTTKHPVVYWLNPYRKREFNYGWFTVEELEQWAEGQGPVVKAAAAAKTADE